MKLFYLDLLDCLLVALFAGGAWALKFAPAGVLRDYGIYVLFILLAAVATYGGRRIVAHRAQDRVPVLQLPNAPVSPTFLLISGVIATALGLFLLIPWEARDQKYGVGLVLIGGFALASSIRSAR